MEVEKIFRQNPRNDIMQLKRQRKRLRPQYQNTENKYEKRVLIERIKIINEHITDKMKENKSRRNKIKYWGKIWEIERKVQRKHQTPHTIKNEKTTESKVHHRF